MLPINTQVKQFGLEVWQHSDSQDIEIAHIQISAVTMTIITMVILALLAILSNSVFKGIEISTQNSKGKKKSSKYYQNSQNVSY